VDRVHAAGAGDGWLAAALPRVERELAFWRTLRDTPCGLAAYGSHGSDAEALSCLEAIEQTRFRVSAAPADRVRTAHDLIASCESGWDFTPRFGYSCRDLCPVDLNALLAASEDLVGIWRARLGLPGAEAWRRAAARRRSLLDDLCWDPDLATWLDWDMATSRRRPQPSAAAGYALWLGTVDPAKAQAWVARALPRLLMAGGVTTCEPGPRTQVWQWDHPNAWPPLQYAVVHGLHRHGFTIEARTVAEAWGRAVLGGWRSTGQLWEKPNAVTGGNDVVDEYPMPAMLGWTAGVWAHFRERGWITDPG
jgi:alpha,alpha-trehalase